MDNDANKSHGLGSLERNVMDGHTACTRRLYLASILIDYDIVGELFVDIQAMQYYAVPWDQGAG